MKRTTVGIIIFIMCLFVNSYAGEVNQICKTDCLGKGRSIGYCNSVCSTEDEAGNVTKDKGCISSCLEKGNMIFNCYQSCPQPEDKQGVKGEPNVQEVAPRDRKDY